MGTKLQLRVPTFGKKVGDEIEVADKATADALVANGSAKPVAKAEKSERG